MANKRLEFHSKLLGLFSKLKLEAHVYFQPPESAKLSYPCIIYERNSGEIKRADNISYDYTYSYEVKVIDKNPDSQIVDAMFAEFKMIRYNRHFVSDNLNHDVFIVYY